MKKVLFINHDITPYVADTELSLMGKMIPKAIQESGCEIRTFMPRWGNINERRGQLHEVIRLSGLNISINDTDHPLIIKVASIPQTKVQVYFIDNEEFFSRRGQTEDAEGNPYADNGERAIFFARGVIETIKKLRWIPDVIHCQGWMSSFVPMYIKKAYYEEPAVCNAKIVTSLFEEQPKGELESNLKECIAYKDVTIESLQQYPDKIDKIEMAKMAIDYSDGVIVASENVPQDIADYTKNAEAKVLNVTGYEDVADKYNEFYDTLLAK